MQRQTAAEPAKPSPEANHHAARLNGVWLVVIAAILWSTSGFFTQSSLLNVWSIETRGIAIAFWRACFALVLLIPMVRRISWAWGMIPMVLCFVCMNWSFLTSIVAGSPANTIWLQNLAPAWVMLGAVLLFREPTALRDWMMLATCISGVLFILVMEHFYGPKTSEHRWWAPWLAIASGVFYAGVILCMRALKHHDSGWLVTINHVATAVVAFPLFWWSGAAMPTGWLWLILAGIGIIQLGAPYLLFAKGLQTTPSHIASLITLLEPVLLPVWAHLTRMNDPNYHPPGWWTWVGAACILMGLAIRNGWPDPNRKVSQQEELAQAVDG